ncbi:MAG: acyloxyacyl hydrolase [Kiloniellales bacterium]
MGFAGLLAGLLFLSPAAAEEPHVDEVKAGVLLHDVAFLGSDEEEGLDFNLELLFRSPELLAPLWSPRPHVGLSVNSAGDTSQLYAGLTWTFYPLESPLWIAASVGGAVHDGELDDGPDGKALGSRALFRLAAEIGYDITPAWRVSLVFDHLSNASLADKNEGLNNAGLRLGCRF